MEYKTLLYNCTKKRKALVSLFLVSALLFPLVVEAGFFEMPDTTKMPELKRRSYLKDLDIPNVRERDPDPEAGPRLNVLRFKLQGIVEYPELGITRQDIEALIEEIRFDLMNEYQLLNSGFTKKEIEEISRLLIEIEDETTERHVTDVEVQRLIYLIREQRLKRGITLGQIETVADKITRFYRQRGFILAKAYIPEQEVRDGVVTLTLLLGTLGEVSVEEGEIYSSDQIAAVFDDMLALPVTSWDIEEHLYLVNDFPGLSAVGFFEPGDQVGDTRLRIKPQREERFQGVTRIDNHGSEQTGEYRLYGEAQANNLLGLGDQLTLGGLVSSSPDANFYGLFRYSASLFTPRFYTTLAASSNQFVLGDGQEEDLNQLDLYGETQMTELSLSYKLKRSRVSTHSIYMSAGHVTSTLESNNEQIQLKGLLDNEVDTVSMGYTFDVLQEKKRRLHQGSVSFLTGSLKPGLDLGKETDFSIFSANYTLLMFWQVPGVDASTRLLFRTNMQYSEESLSSINQFSLAGPTVAKAFPVNTFSADSGIYAGVEWIFDKPEILDFKVGERSFNDIVQPYLFLDAAYGVQASLIADEDDVDATLVDAGFGFRVAYDNFSGNFQVALPVEKSFSSDVFDESNEGAKLVFDLQYRF